MSAPLTGNKRQNRRAYQQISQIREVIEMKLVNLSKQLNIKVSQVLSTTTPAKLLGGLALGALLMTATALPTGSAWADEPASPAVNTRSISTDQFWGPYYERMIEAEGRWARLSPKLAIGGGDDADEDGYVTSGSPKLAPRLGIGGGHDSEEDGYVTSASARLAPVGARLTINVNFADEDGYFTSGSEKLAPRLGIGDGHDSEEDGYFISPQVNKPNVEHIRSAFTEWMIVVEGRHNAS